MRLDGIEYVVALFVGKLSSDNIEEHYFNDFQELNKFVRENRNTEKYYSGPLKYSLIEVVDGKPDSLSWTKNIKFEEFTDEKIEKELEEQRELRRKLIIFSQKFEDSMKTINYTGEAENYKGKHRRLKDFAYVCPNCIREVEYCKCESYPYYLIQIDRLILPVIRELNENGYKTTGCCAGHLDMEDEFKSTGVYICFDKDYDFSEPIPDGAVYSKIKHSVSLIPKEEEYSDLEDFQRKAIWKLSDWAEMLLSAEDTLYFEEDGNI